MHPIIKSMMNHGLSNYITPGLYSHRLGGKNYGKVRIFTADRQTRDTITPHSHRFDFMCYVLEGVVHNTIYERMASNPNPFYPPEHNEAQWIISTITQVCGPGGVVKFEHTRETEPSWYRTTRSRYDRGKWYEMNKDQIHSITFSNGAAVLFFEGPEQRPYDHMLEPWVNGKLVPTFKVEPWMFEKLP